MRFSSPEWILAMILLLATAAPGCATSHATTSASLTGNPALDYYPLLLGWGWAYDVENDGRKVLALYSVVERRQNVAVIKNGDDRIESSSSPTESPAARAACPATIS